MRSEIRPINKLRDLFSLSTDIFFPQLLVGVNRFFEYFRIGSDTFVIRNLSPTDIECVHLMLERIKLNFRYQMLDIHRNQMKNTVETHRGKFERHSFETRMKE